MCFTICPVILVASFVAQAGLPVEIPATGLELFRTLLDRAGVKPMRAREMARLPSEDVILILLGDPSPKNADMRCGDPLDYSVKVMRGGGAVLIATDTALDLGDRFRGLRGGISGARLECDNEKACHRAWRDCPYLVPIHTYDETNPVGLIFGGLDRVATNIPSYLAISRQQGGFCSPLAKFPPGCGVASGPRNSVLFAVGGDGSNGFTPRAPRLLVMADDSVLINQMLLEPETDNLKLASHIIEFLQGAKKRNRCLFVENGSVVEKFDGFAKPNFRIQNLQGRPY